MPLTIKVTLDTDGTYAAFVNDQLYAKGNTVGEAIGNLILLWPAGFNIRISSEGI